MAIRIFRTQRNSRESWLAVNDDGSATYHVENFGQRMSRDGVRELNRTMSASEAKSRWPSYTNSIDMAVAEVIRQDKSLGPIAAGPSNDSVKVRLTKTTPVLATARFQRSDNANRKSGDRLCFDLSYASISNSRALLMRLAAVVMTLLFVASLFEVPRTYRAEGKPLMLMWVGIMAVGALRRRAREPKDSHP